MKIDFRRIEVKDIEGNIIPFDMSKVLGNAIYQKTADLELARDIYRNGEVELTQEQVECIKDYVKTAFVAFVQEAVIAMLE